MTVDPFVELKSPGGPKVSRARYLSDAEIRQVWRALDTPERFKVSPDVATVLRLILTTAVRAVGCRRPYGRSAQYFPADCATVDRGRPYP